MEITFRELIGTALKSQSSNDLEWNENGIMEMGGIYIRRKLLLLISVCRPKAFAQGYWAFGGKFPCIHGHCIYMRDLYRLHIFVWIHGMYHSVATVARSCVHCCKGNTSSQWRMAIFDPLGLRNPWTDWVKIWQNSLRPTPDPACKLGVARKGGLGWGIGEVVTSRAFFLSFLLLSWTHAQLTLKMLA